MRRTYVIVLMMLMVLAGCQWQSKKAVDEQQPDFDVSIVRYDRIENLYLTLADFAALHQMRTDYPVQTRTLIENVLQLGQVNAPDINTRFLMYFQDSTLQALVADVERQYEDVDDLNAQLTAAFRHLTKLLPDIKVPQVYTQIGSLDQSIVVTDSMLGISLDKYLGADYPAYLHYDYTERQRKMMTREYIVPDCLSFYLLSLFPLADADQATEVQRHWHMSKIQMVVNSAIGQKVFSGEYIDKLESYRKSHPQMSTARLLMLEPF